MSEVFANSDVVAALVSVAAMIVTLLSARKALRLQRLQIRIGYRSQVREWACEVVAVMSESVTACELDPEKATDFFGLRNDLRTRLSELIDRGRWFFENTAQGEIGQWKEGAFRGLSPEVLSTIKSVLKLVERLCYKKKAENSEKRQQIVAEKRKFVSEIQRLLQPSATASELDENAFRRLPPAQ